MRYLPLKSTNAEEIELGPNPTETTPLKPQIWPHLGLVYMLCASVCFVAMNLTVRAIRVQGDPLPTLQIQFCRGFFGTVITVGLMVWQRLPEPFGEKSIRKWLYFRAVTGFMSVGCSFFAMSYLTVAENTVIQFLSPVLSGLIAYYYLNEPWGMVDILAGLGAFGGVSLIARPWEGDTQTQDDGRLFGMILSLLAAFFAAVTVVAIRKMGNRIHVLHNALYFHAPAILFSLGLTLVVPKSVDPLPWRIPTRLDTWIYMFLAGAFGVCGQLGQAKAFSLDTVARVSNMIYSQAVFAFVAELLFWSIYPHPLTLLGCLIIIGVLVGAARFKSRK
ncbi:hypothetical protein EDD86DRAFT_215029 [Gorgonomyces haynaldii]|nr:hypothetical protein EDD86DRAFT_215029 [Gorgonomyces haynaldii]